MLKYTMLLSACVGVKTKLAVNGSNACFASKMDNIGSYCTVAMYCSLQS